MQFVEACKTTLIECKVLKFSSFGRSPPSSVGRALMPSLSPCSFLFLFPCLLFCFHFVCSFFLRFNLFSLFFVVFLFLFPWFCCLFPCLSLFCSLLLFFVFFPSFCCFFPPLSVRSFFLPFVFFFRSFGSFFSSVLLSFSCFPRSAPSSLVAWAFFLLK